MLINLGIRGILSMRTRRIVIALTGASGVIYGIRLLEELSRVDEKIETITIISEVAEEIIRIETDYDPSYVKSLANRVFSPKDLTAPVASGSYLFDAVVIIPCSMKTLGAIANGFANNLIVRVAEVAMKERRKLILVPRETPLSSIHLENMLKLSRAGVMILLACPAFYHKPRKISDLIDYIVGKVLDQLNIEHDIFKRWSGEILP